MSNGIIAVNILAAFLVAFVIWWFFGEKMKPDVVNVEIPVTIVIKDGIYQPSEIRIPANKQVTLHFLRKDDSACAATVIFPQLKSSYDIPKNIVVAVILPPQPPGIIDFTCRMGMYRGKLVVA